MKKDDEIDGLYWFVRTLHMDNWGLIMFNCVWLTLLTIAIAAMFFTRCI